MSYLVMESNQIQNHKEEGQELPKHAERNQYAQMIYVLPGSIIIFALIIGGSIIFAANNIIAPRIGNTVASSAQLSNPQNTPPPSGPIKISLDDDAVMGNKDAPVTIIEFGDFECPFCKKSFEELLPQLKRDYIDTGKVKFVYRDFPLDFHENARKEAEAAECARDQGGDASYFKYHDQIYTKTESNGTGLALTQLPVIAKSLGMNTQQFQQCLDSNKYADEVEKDYQDGMAAGITGTPGWFIGKSNNDNTISAPAVEGAQPYTVFKTMIEEQLK
jgi:protein-disulfide isomerase